MWSIVDQNVVMQGITVFVLYPFPYAIKYTTQIIINLKLINTSSIPSQNKDFRPSFNHFPNDMFLFFIFSIHSFSITSPGIIVIVLCSYCLFISRYIISPFFALYHLLPQVYPLELPLMSIYCSRVPACLIFMFPTFLFHLHLWKMFSFTTLKILYLYFLIPKFFGEKLSCNLNCTSYKVNIVLSSL